MLLYGPECWGGFQVGLSTALNTVFARYRSFPACASTMTSDELWCPVVLFCTVAWYARTAPRPGIPNAMGWTVFSPMKPVAMIRTAPLCVRPARVTSARPIFWRVPNAAFCHAATGDSLALPRSTAFPGTSVEETYAILQPA